jgi:two-component system CheB/CheR fusion protein
MRKALNTKSNDNPVNSSGKETPSPSQGHVFPVAGIGASAGGLEALEQFLRHVPDNSGIAYIIIQHLDPAHKGIMHELLQRVTPMKVVQVKDRMKVEPNCVYVIPPNTDMSILHGKLHLFEPIAGHGLRLPIDYFFRSLAEDCQERSIGVILSGMGSDGTIGVRAIKEKAGLILVQEPGSAKFDSMPRSVIDAGLADIVAPAEELPERILSYLHHAPLITAPEPILKEKDQSALEKIIILLREQTGNDFIMYKKSTICRRIERRMTLHQLHRIDVYVKYLQENPQELKILFKELLIGVTNFFRDPAAWERLKETIVTGMLAQRPTGQALRAWVAGCSTGEEAYSLAIIFKEALDQVKPKETCSLQIFATDLDQDAVDKARQGFFPANIAADVSPERLRRFFVEEENGYRVTKGIRDMVIFAPQNLIMDPPFTKLDILTCRNLLIYLGPELQKKLIPLFHYSLAPDGILFLGNAETIGAFTPLFTPVDRKMRLYRRRENKGQERLVEFPSSFAPALSGAPSEPIKAPPPEKLQTLADQLLLQRYSPPAVLVNDKGDILYISGRTGRYLEPAAGKANWNIFAMAREGLRYDLAGAFQKAVRTQEDVSLRGIEVKTDSRVTAVDLTVHFISEPLALRGMVMIVFTEVPIQPQATAHGRSRASSADAARVAELKEKLQYALEELQSAREEAQTSQEELHSANEELQSTNEELVTSKEEMQSLNEELQTVNAEQMARLDELTLASDDMKNLLNSTNIATVFLDRDLRVRRFTTGAEQIYKLIAGDVGRPLSDLVTSLNYPELFEDARKVLRTLVFSQKQVSTENGRWFEVRIMPYRTIDDVINGVVITFMDITGTKLLEAELRETERNSQGIFGNMASGFVLHGVVTDEAGVPADFRFIKVNPRFERLVGMKTEDLIGKTLREALPEAGQSWGDAYAKTALTGEPVSFDYSRDGRLYRASVYTPVPGKVACLFTDLTGAGDTEDQP